MNENDIHRVYFLGIGGIGMSAIARYFNMAGKAVAGYDRVATTITDQLIREGIDIHFEDDKAKIPAPFMNSTNTLVVYTPAVPRTHSEFNFFLENGFEMLKRSKVLGKIMEPHISVAIAGTHGKTTISSMTAHIFRSSEYGCNAFMGGIVKNFNSNLVINNKSNYYIAEADEFDRSFLTLFPDYAVISAIDDDHLDIYGSRKNLLESFSQFVQQVKRGGTIVLKNHIDISIPESIKAYRYSLETPCDYYAFNIRREGLFHQFGIHTPFGDFDHLKLGVSGKLNIENAVAAFAIAQLAGIGTRVISKAIQSYQGVQRRFDIRISDGKLLYIDDYAHHPEELRAFITSVRELVPGKRICGIFQPHLFSRTRDFADGFGRSLSLLDDVILLDIYPAREDPIEGVSSTIILDKITNNGVKLLSSKNELFGIIHDMKPEVLVTMGAGDIDQMVEPMQELLMKMNP